MPMTEAELRRRLAALVRAGQLTQAQADDRLARVTPDQEARQWGGPSPSAPFRFVGVNDQVANGSQHSYGKPLPGGLCARLDVVWAIESPFLIGEENPKTKVVQPIRLGSNGPFVIPGASLRGMTRAATEIVALGRLGFVNLHHRYGLRDFEHRYYAQASVSQVDKVKAGWLAQVGAGKDAVWQLTPLGDGWAHVKIGDLSFAGGNWKGSGLAAKYGAARMMKGGLFDFLATETFSVLPTDAYGRRIVKPDKHGGQTGVFVFSGAVPGSNSNKRFEYVFYEGTKSKSVDVTSEKKVLFERLYSKPSKNKLEADGNWKTLKKTLEASGRIPVFYVGDPVKQGEDFFFGLTRLFKIPHRHSVGRVVELSHGQHVLVQSDGQSPSADFVENLFGYVREPDEIGGAAEARVSTDKAARKGRIAFFFARLVGGESAPEPSDPVETIMMAPRASYASFYLRGDNKDYSADRPKLAGRKRYLPRWSKVAFDEALKQIKSRGQQQIDAVRQSSSSGRESDDIKAKVQFLMPGEEAEGFRFESQIRLHNVSKEELGAVLFALTHGGDPQKTCRHMLGRGKSFGAGQIRVEDVKLSIIENDNPVRKMDVDHRDYLDEFVKRMRQIEPLYPDIPSIREFLGVSIPAAAAEQADTLEYMPLKSFRQIRDNVKPLKPAGGRIQGPARGPSERAGDGRLLPTPEHKTWKK